MNKQEAIEKIKQFSLVNYSSMEFVEEIINLVNQIHEPPKVVIPKFVAEWYERNKNDLDTAIYDTIAGMYREAAGENDDLLDMFEKWLVNEDNSISTLVQMQLSGYEIEREQLFTVEIPDPNRKGTNRIYLGKSNPDSKVIIHKGNFNPKKNKNLWLTESEIKKDFAWAWQFAKEVE